MERRGRGRENIFEQINGETPTYLHHDQQGSTRLLTGSAGTVTGTTTFDAYGNKTGSTGTSTTPLGYDAQYTSSDTGLIYLRARAYDPATAQFLSTDPITAITRAPYTYAADNPLNFGDPTGLWTPTEGLEKVSNEIGEEISNVSGGLLNGLTGGLLGGSGNACSTGYAIGEYGALLGVLLPEDWGIQVLGRIGKVFPRVSDFILKVQTNKRVTEPGNVKIVIATLEKLKHLL
ncbi:MAG: RHS repeat-associated core domain-containing protein [Solirubrobacterales bacterium]|nr:RHS repeat-associated core domain-containing protein [Solirubrobacterales bacterium]